MFKPHELAQSSQIILERLEPNKMKQHDVDVSPPAFLWDPHLNLANVTFDLDTCDL